MPNILIVTEILMTGFFTSVILLYHLYFTHDPNFNELITFIKNNDKVSVLIILFISYQLGWLINAVSYGITYPIYLLRKKNICSDTTIYEKRKGTLFQRGSNDMIKEVLHERTLSRLFRNNLVNLFILFIVLILLNQLNFLVGFLIVLSMIFVFIMWYLRINKYFTEIKSAYDIIMNV